MKSFVFFCGVVVAVTCCTQYNSCQTCINHDCIFAELAKMQFKCVHWSDLTSPAIRIYRSSSRCDALARKMSLPNIFKSTQAPKETTTEIISTPSSPAPDGSGSEGITNWLPTQEHNIVSGGQKDGNHSYLNTTPTHDLEAQHAPTAFESTTTTTTLLTTLTDSNTQATTLEAQHAPTTFESTTTTTLLTTLTDSNTQATTLAISNSSITVASPTSKGSTGESSTSRPRQEEQIPHDKTEDVNISILQNTETRKLVVEGSSPATTQTTVTSMILSQLHPSNNHDISSASDTVDQTSSPNLVISEVAPKIVAPTLFPNPIKSKQRYQRRFQNIPLNEKALRRKIKRDACILARDFIIYKDVDQLGGGWVYLMIRNPMNTRYNECKKLLSRKNGNQKINNSYEKQ